ncbi:MAG TPA: Gfo/Idh/MocA family oxidoreductase [Verrucomicrobiae bacterium]|jgi:predicted dehydrogenase|nr:Gfo/Idh/MocA family oxidoreductase [Verrucomicrobiae bacterium]
MVKPFFKSLVNRGESLITRRDFIGTTAAAGAGLLLTSCSDETAPAPVAKKSGLNAINVGLVGYGMEGAVLSESLMNIMNTGDIKVMAVCDIWDYARKKGKNTYKANGFEVNDYENYEDMLSKEKDLQAVIVAVPDFWHAPVTNACLKAGLHVYCEKMMSNTLDGARSMVKTMRETGKLLQIGHQRRSNPRYLFTLNRLLHQANFCGRLTAAQAQWNRAVAEDFGWPKHSEMSADRLTQYGYKDMHQFRNWRWFKGLGGGPLSDLGAHQIDIFNWWLGVTARSVIASGGLDYYKNHEWYDNAMVVYEFPLAEGVARAFYQVQTTTSAGGGYFEMFMGDDGTIKMSEDPALCAIYREARATAVSWDDLVAKNYVRVKEAPATDSAKVDVRETAQLLQYEIPVFFSKPPHQPHLENFFSAVRGTAKLNCPADEAFRSEYIIHKANEAIAAEKRITITPEETEVV